MVARDAVGYDWKSDRVVALIAKIVVLFLNKEAFYTKRSSELRILIGFK